MKPNSETISVIIPVYNGAHYIQRCLDSLISKTKHPIEIILVNDGSIDQSGDICDAYAKKDQRIHVIHTKNQGAASARNEGLRLMRGAYVSFLDVDDYIEDGMLDSLYEGLKHNACEMAVCAIQLDKYIQEECVASRVLPAKSGVFSLDNYLDDFEQYYESAIFGHQCNKLYLASIIKENKIQFDPAMTCNEDICFNFDVCQHVGRVYVTEQPFYHYTIQNAQSLSSAKRNNFADYTKTHLKATAFLQDQGKYEQLRLFLQSHYIDQVLNTLVNVYSNLSKQPIAFKRTIIDISENENVQSALQQAKNRHLYKKVLIIMLKARTYFCVFYFIGFRNLVKKIKDRIVGVNHV